MRLDEYQIANALIDTRLVMTSRLLSRDWSVIAGASVVTKGTHLSSATRLHSDRRDTELNL